jgi:predicted Zn-dependent protease
METGHFAQGFRIERGKVGDPVTGIAVAGSLEEVLPRMEAVADAIKFVGDTGAPAVLLSRLDVSG